MPSYSNSIIETFHQVGAPVMQIFLSPIVGAYYRPPAKTILSLLAPGHSLVLDPEPTNPHDPDAIRVCVKLNSIELPEEDYSAVEDELMQYGATWADLRRDEFGEEVEDPLFHIGYVPRSGAKTAKIDGVPSIGNLEVLDIIKAPEWKATLTYSPAGQPIVQIVTKG